MCRKVKCSKCGKATFAGCGMHVEQVLAGVPDEQRCRCHEESVETKTDPSGPSLFRRLFGV